MRVLFPTDGRRAANDAERVLEALGDRDRVSITALSVLERDLVVPDPPGGFMRKALLQRRDLTQRIVDCAKGRLEDAGFDVEARMREGAPGEEIVRAVEEDLFELTVMGAGSHNWLSHALLGSTSTHLLHRSPTSVMIVHEAMSSVGRVHVLFGTDGSEGASIALESFMAFADPARCEVRVVSVVHASTSLFPPSHADAYFEALSRYERRQDQALREQGHGSMRKAVSRLEEGGFQVSGSVLKGYPSESLLKEAEGGGFGLIVVGSRGLGPMKRAFLGSVSDHIARLAPAALVGRGAAPAGGA